MLFHSINAVVNPPVCNYLLKQLICVKASVIYFFVEKIRKIRQNIRPSTYDPAVL